MTRPAAVLFLLAFIIGCGGGGSTSSGTVPSAPSPTPPATPSFRDGWTEQAITADIAPPAPGIGAATTVQSSGYLTREARFEASPYYLWPQPEEYVRQLVYTATNNGSLLRLGKYEAAALVVTLEGEELTGDPRVVAAMDEVAAEASRATGIPISLGPGGAIVVRVDPSQPLFQGGNTVAFAQNSYQGWRIVSSRLVFSEPQWISGAGRRTCDNTALHEMGHALGLWHSNDPQDVMNVCTTRQNQDRFFSDRERVALKMMYRWRRPANAAPDRDPSVAGAVAGPRTLTIVD